eukprot:COSAG06_NODE_1995_length_7888_cov_6.408910_4_plen_194_part_00
MSVPHGFHRMPSGELMSNHVKHYEPADPRRRAQVGDGFLGSIGDATAGAAGAVSGLAGLSAATGIGVPAAVAEGTLAAGLGATGALLHGADKIVDAFRGGGDEQHGDGPRCTATTSKGTRCRNRAMNFGDSTLCYVHTQKELGASESADIRAYRANTAAAAGPGMYRDASGNWVVDESIRLEAGGDAEDAIAL